MFIAMNRFQVHTDRAEDFIAIWRNRQSFLKDVPGFQSFNLLQGAAEDKVTLFSSHAVWDSRADFEAWTTSEAFRKAHAHAGKSAAKDIYAGSPTLELFEAVL